jgi:hypothetical protein
MIFLCGIPTESSLRLVLEQVLQLGLPYVLFNQRDFDDLDLEFQIIDGQVLGWMRLGNSGYRLEQFTGIYSRLMNHDLLPEVEPEPPDSSRRLRCRAVHSTLTRWFELSPARVMTRIAAAGSNLSKPYQAQIIRRYGFDIPETLITNDPQILQVFLARHGRVIYKSISYIRSIVQMVSEHDLKRLDHIRWCPVQFQEFIDGTNIRVHVLDKQVFPTAIHTSVTDYRYAYKQGEQEHLESIEIPADLADRCIDLTGALGLHFAGVDLMTTTDGRVYCLEVNPCPAFSYYELQTGQPIARAVAKYLAGTD